MEGAQGRVARLPDLSRTGRTTRMLGEAKRLARAGRAVYVIAASHVHAKQLESTLSTDDLELGIKFETAESPGNFQWEPYPHLRGAHPNCVVLVDHYAIECKFAWILRELHFWDA